MKLDGERTLRGRAHEILRSQLLAGGLTPGQRVNEVQMAAELGISRGTLREAIRRLEQEGMFISIPHRGTFVRRFTPREAEELQEVRLSLETTAALRVARFWSPPIESFLEERLDNLRAASETPLPFADRVVYMEDGHIVREERTGAGLSEKSEVERAVIGRRKR